MFTNPLSMRNQLHMALAMPLLAVGWALLISGIYHLALVAIQPSAPNESAEMAVWEFMFSFGITSVAVLIASRVGFLAKPYVRKTFLYSLVASSILFLGYLCTGVVSWLTHELF